MDIQTDRLHTKSTSPKPNSSSKHCLPSSSKKLLQGKRSHKSISSRVTTESPKFNQPCLPINRKIAYRKQVQHQKSLSSRRTRKKSKYDLKRFNSDPDSDYYNSFTKSSNKKVSIQLHFTKRKTTSISSKNSPSLRLHSQRKRSRHSYILQPTSTILTKIFQEEEYGENTAIADESEISSNFEKSQTDGMDLTEMSSSEKQMTNETDEDLLLSKIQKMDLNQLENRASPNRTTVKRTRSQKDHSGIFFEIS